MRARPVDLLTPQGHDAIIEYIKTARKIDEALALRSKTRSERNLTQATNVEPKQKKIEAKANDHEQEYSVSRYQEENMYPDVNLQEALKHPFCVELFKDGLMKFMVIENLYFIMEMQLYVKLPREQLRKRALAIIQSYIKPNAPWCLNISAQMRLDVMKKLGVKKDGQVEKSSGKVPNQVPRMSVKDMNLRFIFKDLEKEVLGLMQSNWVLYKKTPGYKLLCQIFAESRHTAKVVEGRMQHAVNMYGDLVGPEVSVTVGMSKARDEDTVDSNEQS